LCQISRDASGSYLLVRLPSSMGVWHIPEGKPTPLIPATGLPHGEPVSAIAW